MWNCVLTSPCRAPKHSAGNQTEQLQWQQLPTTCSTVASAPLILSFCPKVSLQLFTSCALQGPEGTWTCPLVIYSAYLGYCMLYPRAELFFFLICTELQAVTSDTHLYSTLLTHLKFGPYLWSPPCPGMGKAAASSPRVPCPCLCFLLVQSFGIFWNVKWLHCFEFYLWIHPPISSKPTNIYWMLPTYKQTSKFCWCNAEPKHSPCSHSTHILVEEKSQANKTKKHAK